VTFLFTSIQDSVRRWDEAPAEAVEQDGSYSGSEVNRAARLTALAHDGQVLVSDTTEVLLRNRLSVRPLGEHVLHGFRRQISMYQVIADGLPTEFPVLRSAERFAGNCPGSSPRSSAATNWCAKAPNWCATGNWSH
jgi:hypothetical protein